MKKAEIILLVEESERRMEKRVAEIMDAKTKAIAKSIRKDISSGRLSVVLTANQLHEKVKEAAVAIMTNVQRQLDRDTVLFAHTHNEMAEIRTEIGELSKKLDEQKANEPRLKVVGGDA